MRLARRVLLPALLACLTGVTHTFAADSHGGDFLRIDTGAATVGMGSAGLLLADPAVRAWWNPALIADDPVQGIALQHQELFDGELKQDYLAWNGRFRDLPLSVYLLRQAVEDVPLVNALDAEEIEQGGRPQASYHTTSDWILGLASARQLNEELRVGLSLKLLHRDLAAFTGQGIGLDAGMTYNLRPDLQLGVSFRDLTGTLVVWEDGKQDWIPPEAAIGAAWRRDLPRFRSSVAIEADLRTELDGESPDRRGNWRSAWMHGGLEWSFLERFFLRGGYAEGDPAAGAGIQMGSLQVDYAWRPHEDLGASHLVTLYVQTGKWFGE